jgi:hypothetical protein
MCPSFVCHQSRIYVVLPGKLASLSFPDNDAILLSLQESFPDCKGNEPGNLTVTLLDPLEKTLREYLSYQYHSFYSRGKTPGVITHSHVTFVDIITSHHLTFSNCGGMQWWFGVTFISSHNSSDADT